MWRYLRKFNRQRQITVKRYTAGDSTGEQINALSADIKLLGNMLGEIIEEQHGPEALALVEKIRAQAKLRRENPQGSEAGTTALLAEINRLDLQSKKIL